MVLVYCDNEECDGERMDCTDTDDRQEWVEEKFQCSKCDKVKIHRTEYDQNGLVTSDEIYDDK